MPDRAMKADVSENTVKLHVRNLIKRHGCWWYANAPGPFGGAGVDYLGCHRGRFFAVEVKKPAVKKPTPRQAATLKAIEQAGGKAFFVNNSPSLQLLEGWFLEGEQNG